MTFSGTANVSASYRQQKKAHTGTFTLSTTTIDQVPDASRCQSRRSADRLGVAGRRGGVSVSRVGWPVCGSGEELGDEEVSVFPRQVWHRRGPPVFNQDIQISIPEEDGFGFLAERVSEVETAGKR